MLNGNTVTEKIWNYLNNFFTQEGAAGLMGNLQAESGLKSNNLQNSVNTRLNVSDVQYTSLVDKGIYTGFCIDNAGYGLAQWTSPGRKSNLYAYAKSKKTSISDLEMQLEFLVGEMKASYKKVYELLRTTTNVKEASDMVLLKYERPKDKSEAVKQKRFSLGIDIYNRYTSNTKTIKVGDKVKVINAITYDGKPFKTFHKEYEVISVKQDRIVIGVNKIVTTAININNIQKI